MAKGGESSATLAFTEFTALKERIKYRDSEFNAKIVKRSK